MEILAGTSGYSYKEWKGPFYPEKLPAKEMLAYYAERLPTVEINNTFYRLPKTDVLATWASQVPEGFRFVVKASRRITHFKRLKDVISCGNPIHPRHQTRIPFWACSRFSASSHTTDCVPSRTSEVTSSPR